jgi:hypothetical protein
VAASAMNRPPFWLRKAIDLPSRDQALDTAAPSKWVS